MSLAILFLKELKL